MTAVRTKNTKTKPRTKQAKAAQAPTLPTPIKTSAPLPDALVIDALTKSFGNVSHAARSLGMTRTALSDRIARTPELKQITHDARQSIVDAAENALFSCVTSKQPWAVCFALKTLGKERGYVERQEMTGKDGEKLHLETVVVLPSNSGDNGNGDISTN